LGVKFGDLVTIHADQTASDGAFHQAELELPEERRVPIELSSSPLWSDYSEPVGTVWVLHDISQRKELEDQLRQSQKLEAIGRLAGGVAHDFNNLLTVIMGYCNLILDTGDTHDGIRTDVEGIQNAAQRAVSLTRQLLAFSRHQVMKPRIIDVNNLILEMEKMIRRLITEDVTMHFYLDATKSHVHVDPGQIEQVLINLAVNARDAMPDGGTLVIQTHNETLERPQQTPVDLVPPGRYVVVTVRDTGVGIDGQILSKVFDPFFTTKEDGKGTGLGLSTVYGIVQQSGGYINVETSPGNGTSFSIYLTQRSPVEDAEHEGEDGNSQSRGHETILVVEDEDFVRTLVTKILSRKGYNVLEARNGGEALLICEQYQEPIDMLVSDLVMPHMDGNKLAARLKQERPDIRLLLMSGYPDKTIQERGAPDPSIAFIHKPFNAEAFGRKVREILDS
jgi:signal transduction histidine kinase